MTAVLRRPPRGIVPPIEARRDGQQVRVWLPADPGQDPAVIWLRLDEAQRLAAELRRALGISPAKPARPAIPRPRQHSPQSPPDLFSGEAS